MATVCLVGATGLVGAHIYSTFKGVDGVSRLFAYARKELSTDPKVTPIISQQSSEWPKMYPSGTELFVSALGTTQANAGGASKQREIDYDLNLSLARAAKAAGVKTYVLVSVAGANSSSMFEYIKTKGELEDAVKAIDFEHVVIVQPGLLLGSRSNDLRTAEFVLQKVAGLAGAISGNILKDVWAQDADVVAKAAVRAGLDCLEGRQKEKVWVVSQADIVQIGRKDWKS